MRRNVTLLFLLVAVLACVGLVVGGGCRKKKKRRIFPVEERGPESILWSLGTLQQEMDSNPDLVVLDCRQKASWGNGATYIPYDVEHIEGSYYIDFFDFGDPYPDNQALITETLSDLGITVDTKICLYDAGIANPQGKVFYQLERQGCTDVHILDGGFPVWLSAGGAVSPTATPAPTQSTFVPSIDDSIHYTLSDIKAAYDAIDGGSDQYVIIDYREAPLYWGHKICPDAALTGHITHAVLLDWHDYYDSSTGLFLSRADINSITITAGGDSNKVNVLMCNKGWRSGIAYFALRHAGWSKSSLVHYVGGFREWCGQGDTVTYPVTSEACYTYPEKMPPGNTSAKRFAGAFAQVGPRLYCIGGHGINYMGEIRDNNQVYDFSDDSFIDLAPLPDPRAFSAAAAVGNSIYVMGGLDNAGAISDVVYCYDTVGGTWDDGTVEAPLPVGRWSYAAAAIGDTIYICGGLTAKVGSVTANYSNEVYAYDTVSRIWDTVTLPDMPTRRRCHALVAIGDSLYLVGGFWWDDTLPSPACKKDLADVWELDTASPTAWIQRASMPMNLAGHAATVANGKIYVPGGWSMTGIKFDVLEYDPVGDSWLTLEKNTRSAQIGWGRYWYFIGASGNYIATIGGYSGGSGNIYNTPHSGKLHFHQVYKYDITLPDNN